jgi:hypothetical protein
MDLHRLYAKLRPLFRARRMHRFAEAFQIGSGTRVLDIGGSRWIWRSLPVTPKVVLLNLLAHNDHGDGFTWYWVMHGSCRSRTIHSTWCSATR